MRKTVLFLLLIFARSISIAQSDSLLSENFHFSQLDDSTKLLIYLDTIDKYIYRDVKLTEKAIADAEAIVSESSQLSNSQIIKFVLEKVLFALNKDDVVNSYKIIKENEYLLNDESVNHELEGRFNYLNGFTHMAVGDIASAQKIYYDISKSALERKDTSLFVSSQYSLGQLYADEKDYQSAKKIYLALFEIIQVFKERPSTIVLMNLELCEVYFNLKEYDKALEIIEHGLTLLENEKIDRLRPDFLLLKGEIALKKNDLNTAKAIYQELAPKILNNKDPINEFNLSFFYAKILSHQKKYHSALSTCVKLIAEQDSSAFNRKKLILEKAHDVANKMGNPALAYQYAIQQNGVEEQIHEQEKKQETAYLKIKFESEEKEKENQQLALDILEKQYQNRFLYFISCAFLLGILILIIAFFQKKKFSQKLQEEVKKRTSDLETSNQRLNKTNKELFQFSHICSHDLKEPVLTIKNFLGLIEKENYTESNAQYFQFVNQNLTRLTNLLEQIRIYFDLNDNKKLVLEKINVHEIHETVIADLSEVIHKKNALVNLKNELDSDYIFCSKLGLILVLKKLTQNAIRFNNAQQPIIDIRFAQLDDQLSITVEDNGIGIKEKHFDYIFEPFKTLKSRHTHNATGLGLAICKKTILALGGEIKVTSTVDRGSIFHMVFKNSKNDKDTVHVCKEEALVLLE